MTPAPFFTAVAVSGAARTAAYCVAAVTGVLAGPAAARAQNTPPSAPMPPAAEQIAAAVLPLPADLRAGATVMGYRTTGKLEVLRQGSNRMNCLALYVVRPDFHVACYHDSLEPFMARGRELRAQGVTGAQVDTVRYAEIRNGNLKMPAQGSLYSLTGPKSVWNPAAGTATGASQLTVLYVPFATAASIGISTRPASDGTPWLMNAGTPKAHVMMVGRM